MTDIRIDIVNPSLSFEKSKPGAKPDAKISKVSTLKKNIPPTTLSGKSNFLKRGLEGIEANETTCIKKIKETFSTNAYSIDDKK